MKDSGCNSDLNLLERQDPPTCSVREGVEGRDGGDGRVALKRAGGEGEGLCLPLAVHARGVPQRGEARAAGRSICDGMVGWCCLTLQQMSG